jgi:hypothetical protein
MRMAGRFSRRLRAWTSPGEDKHKMAEQHLADHEVKPGTLLSIKGTRGDRRTSGQRLASRDLSWQKKTD